MPSRIAPSARTYCSPSMSTRARLASIPPRISPRFASRPPPGPLAAPPLTSVRARLRPPCQHSTA
eukprot:1440066-Rhodomonas_salina.2